MTTYVIEEKATVNSIRKGYELKAKTLAQAKRLASRNRAFYNTVIVIKHCGDVVAYKENGRWQHTCVGALYHAIDKNRGFYYENK